MTATTRSRVHWAVSVGVGLLAWLALAVVAGFLAMVILGWGLHGCWGQDCARGWEDTAVPIFVFVVTPILALVVGPIVGLLVGRMCFREFTDTDERRLGQTVN